MYWITFKLKTNVSQKAFFICSFTRKAFTGLAAPLFTGLAEADAPSKQTTAKTAILARPALVAGCHRKRSACLSTIRPHVFPQRIEWHEKKDALESPFQQTFQSMERPKEPLLDFESFLCGKAPGCYKIFHYICLLNRLKKSITLSHFNNIPWN